MAHYNSYSLFEFRVMWITVVILELIHAKVFILFSIESIYLIPNQEASAFSVNYSNFSERYLRHIIQVSDLSVS